METGCFAQQGDGNTVQTNQVVNTHSNRTENTNEKTSGDEKKTTENMIANM